MIRRAFAAAVTALLLVVITGGGTGFAQQFSNAYTRLNLDRCAQVDRPGSSERRGAFRCKGFKNVAAYDVFVFEDDGRYHLSIGPDAFDLKAAGQTLTPFNTIADDLEWRLERRAGEWQPFAVIARYFTEIEENGDFYRGEVLVVLRIAPGEACHAAYIDAKANANANRLAREAADRIVRRFDCASDEPTVLGERGRSLGPTS